MTMAVEVRQLVVKSNVVQRQQDEEEQAYFLSSEEKKAMLAECRRLVMEVLREERNR